MLAENGIFLLRIMTVRLASQTMKLILLPEEKMVLIPQVSFIRKGRWNGRSFAFHSNVISYI